VAKQSDLRRDPRELVPGAPEDLSALCVELLRHDPDRRAGTDAVMKVLGVNRSWPEPVEFIPTASSTRTHGTELVGRQAQLRALQEAFQRTLDGELCTAFVQGESGVGKELLPDPPDEILARLTSG